MFFILLHASGGVLSKDFIYLVIVFAVVLFLAYVFTKGIAKKGKSMETGKYIEIIDSVSMGLDSKICLVKVCDEYFLISVSKKATEFLTKVEVDIDYEQTEQPQKKMFSGVISNYFDNLSKKKENKEIYSSNMVKADTETMKKNIEKIKKTKEDIIEKVKQDGEN